METEKYNPFLDTPVTRDSNGLLTTSVYRNIIIIIINLYSANIRKFKGAVETHPY